MAEIYIVTGAAGFIGSNFVRQVLRQSGARIIALDKLTYAGNLANLVEVSDNPAFEFVKGDIADRSLVRRLIREVNPTAIINFAAESHVDRSIDSPADFLETNVTGTFTLLEAAREYYFSGSAPSGFRFLQVSTDEVYGSLGDTGYFTETTAYSPNSPYSASKASADHFAGAYFATYGLPVLITNCSNNYGPFQFPEKLIPLMILKALEGEDLPIYGDGSNIRDWIYVEDHCAGVFEVVKSGTPGEKYNLGGNCERSNIEIVDAVCEVLEEMSPAAENPAMVKKGVRNYRDLKTFVKDRPGHDHRYAIDASRVRKDLGWSPVHRFDEGLRKTVSWYLANLEWCQDIRSGKYRMERLGLSGNDGHS